LALLESKMALKEINQKRPRHGQMAERYFSGHHYHPGLFICRQISVTQFSNPNFPD
jgi:hypothetical protein